MYTAENWPIAAKLSFGPEDGVPVVEAPVSVWRDQLQQVKDFGYRHVDTIDDWMNIGTMPEERFNELKALLQELELEVPAVSIGRKSIIDAKDGDANLAMVHALIDRAHALGADIVDLGFMQGLGPKQAKALWFWLEDDGHHDDEAQRPKALERMRELADHAADLGMQLSLEMYEDTFLGTPEGAVQFLKDLDHKAVGLNPDLGNLIRLHRPMPNYVSMHDQVLPYANYWHIKNYIRDEDPKTGSYMSAPVPLKYGVIDYRAMIRKALKLGFQGPFLTEHYGSDWLGVGAENLEYIRSVLRAALR